MFHLRKVSGINISIALYITVLMHYGAVWLNLFTCFLCTFLIYVSNFNQMKQNLLLYVYILFKETVYPLHTRFFSNSKKILGTNRDWRFSILHFGASSIIH